MDNQFDGLVHEKDLTIPVLKVLEKSSGKWVATSKVIEQLQAELKPVGKDAAIIPNRNDNHLSQKIRNIISHRTNPTNPISIGLIEYDQDNHCLRITDLGIKHLSQ